MGRARSSGEQEKGSENRPLQLEAKACELIAQLTVLSTTFLLECQWMLCCLFFVYCTTTLNGKLDSGNQPYDMDPTWMAGLEN